jgi:hypothetical protein
MPDAKFAVTVGCETFWRGHLVKVAICDSGRPLSVSPTTSSANENAGARPAATRVVGEDKRLPG